MRRKVVGQIGTTTNTANSLPLSAAPVPTKESTPLETSSRSSSSSKTPRSSPRSTPRSPSKSVSGTSSVPPGHSAATLFATPENTSTSFPPTFSFLLTPNLSSPRPAGNTPRRREISRTTSLDRRTLSTGGHRLTRRFLTNFPTSAAMLLQRPLRLRAAQTLPCKLTLPSNPLNS
jgi:hypothetical protein